MLGLLHKRALSLPIVAWCALISCAFMLVGWYWDISWHRCVGRDTVWTAAHVAIYIALALAFAYNAMLVLSHTFGASRGSLDIGVLGFRGPAGAFVTLWGVLLQGAAVIFDVWWHEIYGLDIAVVSPPHALIAWGMGLFFFGQLLLVALHRNQAGPDDRAARWAMLVMGAMIISLWSLAADPGYGVMAVRSRLFVATSPFAFVTILVLIPATMRIPWAATKACVIYMGILIGMMQLFQAFPASPRFAPVFHEVTRFYPPTFPLLVIVPAFLIDLIVQRTEARATWRTSALIMAAFVPTFTIVNWLWSAFLSSPMGDNRFFGGGYPGSAFEEHFRAAPMIGADAITAIFFVAALVVALLTARLALGAAGWLRTVAR